MEFVDYYHVMGVSASASADEIKRAYRKLARKYHPDVSQEADSEARFKEVNEAYQVLKDADRRAEYDQLMRHGYSSEQDFQPPPGWQSKAGFSAEEQNFTNQQEFSDFFEHIFGHRAQQQSAHFSERPFDARGQDLHSDLSLSLKDAFEGATVTLGIPKPVIQADGSIRKVQKTLQVKIPTGVLNNQKIRLRGQGGAAQGAGDAGDLYIHVHIQDDDYFHLDGRDVSVNLPVTPWEAALGATIEVRTLNGPVSLTIPENARAGQRLRLKGRGMPGVPPGDQYVVLTIVVPEAITEEQKAHYRSMSSLWSFNPRKVSGDML